MEVFDYKILNSKMDVKILEGKWVKGEAVNETILGQKIGVKNFSMENLSVNRHENLFCSENNCISW